MPRILGGKSQATPPIDRSTDHAVTPAASPPPALRASPPGWRDPRMWIGIAIVAVSVVIGARVLGSADDTVTVWAVADDMGAGDSVGPDDLVAREVRFADAADLDLYFRAADDLPGDLELSRSLDGGELLPRGAVADGAESDLVQVRLSVPGGQVPSAVGSGSLVDVYLSGTNPDGSRSGKAGEAILTGVAVVDAPSSDDSFGASTDRTLDLALTPEQAGSYLSALGKLDSPVITVVKVG